MMQVSHRKQKAAADPTPDDALPESIGVADDVSESQHIDIQVFAGKMGAGRLRCPSKAVLFALIGFPVILLCFLYSQSRLVDSVQIDPTLVQTNRFPEYPRQVVEKVYEEVPQVVQLNDEIRQVVQKTGGEMDFENHMNTVIRQSQEKDENLIMSGAQKVCINANNERTASIFGNKYLLLYGSGVFDYIYPGDDCSKLFDTFPQIALYFQKNLEKAKLLKRKVDLVIVQGDEYCSCPESRCGGHGTFPLRQYYSQIYDNLHIPDDFMYLPLGPRFDFQHIDPSLVTNINHRKNLFNLIISPTSNTRKLLIKLLNHPVTASYFSNHKTIVHLTPSWSKLKSSEADGFIKPLEYNAILLDSKFTLCPAGHNAETFRLFEACEAGSIPVVVVNDNEYNNHKCKNALLPYMLSNAPFIYLNSWEELTNVLLYYDNHPALLEQKQLDLIKWYRTFWQHTVLQFECILYNKISRELYSGLKTGATAGEYLQTHCKDTAMYTPKWYSQPFNNVADYITQITPVSSSVIVPHFKSVPLITGCGRSGTLSVSDFLKSIGIKSVHENVKSDFVSVSWLYAVPDAAVYPFESAASKTYRTSVLKSMRPSQALFSPVVHVVRHPLKVISSTRRCFCGRGNRMLPLGAKSDKRSWDFADPHIDMPSGLGFDHVLRSMLYWLRWNQLISRVHRSQMLSLRPLQIEHLKPADLLSALGMRLESPGSVDVPEQIVTSKHHNSSVHESLKGNVRLPDLSWKDLHDTDAAVAAEVFALAQSYGYEEGNSFESVIE